MARVGLYVDGFNLYHSIDDMKKPHLKWLDLRLLGELLIAKDDTLDRVVYCSAIKAAKNQEDAPRMIRHRNYVAALEARQVECKMGHFVDQEYACGKCPNEWVSSVEKQSDVSLALSVIDDAHRDIVDKVLLLTADSDQVSTLNLFRMRFPDKTIISVAPPGRHHHPKLMNSANGHQSIDKSSLMLCLLPPTVQGAQRLILRPTEYKPPEQII